ncbi:MAG: hypothetical protein K9G33_07185 [Sneathiella sp.]|nr:hypothetical protein [Sneathiella sp.]
MKSMIATVLTAAVLIFATEGVEATSVNNLEGASVQFDAASGGLEIDCRPFGSKLSTAFQFDNVLKLTVEEFVFFTLNNESSPVFHADENDAWGLFKPDPDGDLHHFSRKWIGGLFTTGLRDTDASSRDTSISADSASVIPLPATLPLFFAGLILMAFVGWCKRRRANIRR